ncbi:hypothetical protein GOP47_0004625 [Adiantum capillus-veneris]|uniref:Uncharacterized protein n=1 Tax=Adiantum capillus-veneris TaxID=13818 RepID=A0A9D4ZPR9_ADICA|nr:hypothetical protein GOP47_0004625 [Adiantum capillus-veneris]
MCQGVFPSAFNPCDCPRSELLPYPPMEKVQQGSNMYASSLWAKWVTPPNPPHPHPNEAQQARALAKRHIIQRDLHSTDSKQIGSAASSPLDRPHLVHAFFFDST